MNFILIFAVYINRILTTNKNYKNEEVLIPEGGFAGVQAAIDLQKNKLFDVTLVSNRDFMYLFLISIWILICGINTGKAKIPLADISKKHKFKFIIDNISVR